MAESSVDCSVNVTCTSYGKCVLSFLLSIEHFNKIINSIVDQTRFQISSPPATSVRDIAAAVSASDNFQLIKDFFQYLVTAFKKCLVITHKTKHLKSAKMWGEYHKLRTFHTFKERWKRFLNNFGEFNLTAVFCQYVSHEVFKEVIKSEHPVSTSATPSLQPLTHLEKSAV